MKVKVTAKHIANGKPASVKYCPVALALREMFPRVEVYESYARINESYHYFRRGTRFIRNFDSGVKVKPCTIELESDSQ